MASKKSKLKKTAKDKAEIQDELEIKVEPTEKELLLQQELTAMNQHLLSLKDQVLLHRNENDWLQEEVSRAREESLQYQNYMKRWNERRQDTIISLVDSRRAQIEKINQNKEAVVHEHHKAKDDLIQSLTEKQELKEKLKRELSELSEYKNLRSEQLKKIEELEQKLSSERLSQAEEMRELKGRCVAEKQLMQREFEQDMEQRVWQTQKEAVDNVNRQMKEVEEENVVLRQELSDLIKRTRALEKHERHLKEQQAQLKRQQECAQLLRQRRLTSLHINTK